MKKEKISRKSLDNLTGVRANPAPSGGRDYWRSLDQLADTEEFQELLRREFPEQASEMTNPVTRRNFLKLMGASLAFGGLTSCTIQPTEKIVPYVRAPEYLVPGRPLFYATATSVGGITTGILAESHMGRPTKIEGNPGHPASQGATDAITQASILNLYDPDRSKVVKNAGRINTWGNFLADLDQALEMQRLKKGAGLRILTETVTSPSLGHQLGKLLEEFPHARWHQYEAANRDQARAGAIMAFGEPVNTYFDFSKAEVILSLDADFAYSGPGNVRYARDFANGRRLASGQEKPNRLYMVESTPSCTGSWADHRMALGTRQIESFAMTAAHRLGVESVSAGASIPFPDNQGWIGPVVQDLLNHPGSSLVVAGDQQAPAVHALAHAMNGVLGNVGTTVHYTDPIEVESVDQAESLGELVEAMKAGQVELLLILGANPAYSAPADLDFAGALQQVPFRAHLGLYDDETAALCHWHIPESHFLEAWSDGRSYDGTVSIVQPLILPLYNSKSSHELIGALIGQSGRPVDDILQEYWQGQDLTINFEQFWKQSLHDGLMADTGLPPKSVKTPESLSLPRGTGTPMDEEDLELLFRPDPTILDGRFANNGWLQETPKPISKLTWDNAAQVSPATALRLGLKNEQIVELKLGDRSIEAPIWIVPGQAHNVVTVHLGYGRTRCGRVGNNLGFDVNALRSSSSPWSAAGLKLVRTFSTYPLACTQDHHSMEGRHLVRHADLGEFKKHPDFAHREAHEFPEELTLYSGFEYNGNSWGMAIDLNACIGCNACSLACQSENNIPVVGKDEVRNAREMSWIRVDRYYSGDLNDPAILHQPVPCQQCENAPCELVCPVTATSHSQEGLNDMVYNRCVGTRYCANNCPYKVRRFNFLQYADRETESLKLMQNPDVTIRSRGIMEKCTYCVQRINAARIESKKSGDPIVDGQILTACQQACPTEAIAFGDINDPESKVAQLKSSPLNYGILTELNTRPRTSYLASVRNPNPEIIES